jgi:hypothetical protein
MQGAEEYIICRWRKGKISGKRRRKGKISKGQSGEHLQGAEW